VKLKRTTPTDRFGRDPSRSFSVALDNPRYYRCPHCKKRMRMNPRDFGPTSDWKERPSGFNESDLALFERFGRYEGFLKHDFYCRTCRRPVRLVYQYQERGVGGWWYAAIEHVVEVE
jgi:hypothetical protein